MSSQPPEDDPSLHQVRSSASIDNHPAGGPQEDRSRHSSLLGPYRHHLNNIQFPIYYPRLASSSQAATYCRSMMSSGNGFPTWSVVPSTLPELHFQQGASIGDVGYIDEDGGFRYRFNIFYAKDHPIQGRTLPRNFRPIQPSLTEWEIRVSPDHFQSGKVITSEGVTENRLSSNPLEIEFRSLAREGSVLILPQGASREDLADTKLLHTYIREHASDWYQYLNGYSDVPTSRPIVNGCLFVVTGSDKAKVWNSAMFPPAEEELSRPSVFKYVEKSVTDRKWVKTNSVKMSTERATTAKGEFPCALFLRGISVALNKPLWNHGIAPIPLSSIPLYFIPTIPVSGRRAEVSRLLGRFRRTGGGDDNAPSEAIFHPAIVLSQILLEAESSADVAIVEDSVWCSLVNGKNFTLPELIRLVNSILDRYELVGTEGVAHFVAKNPTELTLKQKFESYLQFFFTGTTRSKSEQTALRKLKKILSKPPPLPHELSTT